MAVYRYSVGNVRTALTEWKPEPLDPKQQHMAEVLADALE